MTVRGAGKVVGVCAVMLALGGCAAATSEVELVPGPSAKPAPAAPAAGAPAPAPSEDQVRTNETRAGGRLRALAAYQTTFVVRCIIDQDDDGCGEFGALRELSGGAVPRGREQALAPDEAFTVFPPRMGTTNALGVGFQRGYCFVVYLPTHAGPAISEDAGAGPVSDPVNANAQETRWCAYAWPQEYGVTGRRVFFVNQEAEVYVASNARPDGKPFYSGGGMQAGSVIPKPGAALAPNKGLEENLESTFAEPGLKGSDGQVWSPWMSSAPASPGRLSTSGRAGRPEVALRPAGGLSFVEGLLRY